MAIPGGFFGRFFGRTISDAAGYGIGGALTRPLEPLLHELTEINWRDAVKAGVTRAVDPELAALADIEGVWDEDTALAEAASHGFDGDRYKAMRHTLDEGVPLATAYETWRRDFLSDDEFTAALRKLHIEERWWSPLRRLKGRLLAPDVLANARQQGFVDAARQRAESELQGVDNERADILFQLSGLPPGVDVGQRAANRNLIDFDTFAQIVREGHTKTKYTDLLWAMRHPVLSAPEYATLHLKGWIDEGQMNAGGALTGFTAAQMNLLFLARGRPISPTQGWNALARDVVGPGGGQFTEDDFLRAIKQSDIRPEYGPTLLALRWNYPSLFQLRRAVQDGSIAPARARRILRYERYEDQDADALIESWTKATGAGVKALTASTLLAEHEGGFMDTGTFTARLRALGYSAAEASLYAELGEARKVASARNATLTTIRQRYVSHQLSRDEMLAQLAKTDAAQEAKDRIVVEWDNAREATQTQLSAAQVKKAYAKNQIQRAEAEDLLAARGWRALDLQRYLDQ